MKIALIGYGGVGKAFINLLNNKKESLENKNIKIIVNYIIKSDGGLYSPDGIDLEEIISYENIKDHKLWSNKTSFKDIISNGDSDTIVELTPTNEVTGEPGLSYIKNALEKGMNVVTGNKGPILLKYKELKEIAEMNKVSLEIGCTTGGALPSVSTGVYGMAGADILSIEGILNGTSNFILQQMDSKDNLTYEEALKIAKQEGIAETNPKLDVNGVDTAIKMIIITNVLLNKNIKLDDVDITGITELNEKDIKEAKNSNGKIKLLGRTFYENNKFKITVKPTILHEDNLLYSVDGKNKGLVFCTDTLGDIAVIGGASGVVNAAASILRDIINLKHTNY